MKKEEELSSIVDQRGFLDIDNVDDYHKDYR